MQIRVGNNKLSFSDTEIKGDRTLLDGEVFYKISNYDQMRPFFMSIVSDSDHWMFISSNGSLTAGRKNPGYSLFPYYTDDKISDMAGTTGSKTLLLVHKDGDKFLWEPFSSNYDGLYTVKRNLYKGLYGDCIVFEEINHDLGVRFQYGWYHSEQYGFIRKSKITNISAESLKIEILDGIQNIVPAGTGVELQNQRSNLVNAYKKNELLRDSKIGIYSLSSNIVDKAEPSEALRCNWAWSAGLTNSNILLSSTQVNSFIRGRSIIQESDVRAEPGAYFLNTELSLIPEAPIEWLISADVNKSIVELKKLENKLLNTNTIVAEVEEDIAISRNELKEIINRSDGIQISNDHLSSARHISNVLFNIMRGGIFDNGYHIEKSDLLDYVDCCNRELINKDSDYLSSLPDQFKLELLLSDNQQNISPDLKRLFQDYLPLYFSRRHGDPSRPWNSFSIDTKDDQGNKILNYEGNWRDIFQNWEALAISFPGYLESMIAKFLNASTADGYNPYRITRSGIDWEVIEPDDPWSFIGYWGDHQIIYLLKLLELSNKFNPGKLQGLLTESIFVFADVPYRIKPFNDLVANPHDTIVFDVEKEEQIEKRVSQIGSDGKLIWSSDDELRKVNLLEKLLIPLLAKLSNFIPDGGIWLNTQRPEWNDANNALVGNGVSMVTLCYIRRYLVFLDQLLTETDLSETTVSGDLVYWFHRSFKIYQEFQTDLGTTFEDNRRFEMVSQLGKSAEEYNQGVYEERESGNSSLQINDIKNFLQLAQKFSEDTISRNKRDDGLYHAYNLVSFEDKGCTIDHLYEMLEGQVGVLTSGFLNGSEALDVLEVMKGSKLFRVDQYSYLLYPDRELPKFINRNTISEELLNSSETLRKMVDEGDKTLVEKDLNGEIHFNSDFHNSRFLNNCLSELAISADEKDIVLDIYESVFNHKEFTGRSGTFYGYEGLNSIYWHMVSKLLLAVQEIIYQSVNRQEDPSVIARLIEHYFEIRAGIGLNKSPELYGAFPTDPYSHTPGNKGAQQPGMTGQVKEDILSRYAELGIIVENGSIQFMETLLRKSEFLTSADTFEYLANDGSKKDLTIEKSSLAFSICQIPIIYKESEEKEIVVTLDNEEIRIDGLSLGKEMSQRLFSRDPSIQHITVKLYAALS